MDIILRYKNKLWPACNLWAALSATIIGATTHNIWLFLSCMVVAIVNFWFVIWDTERAFNGE